MNWWGLAIMWAGAIVACIGCYRLGKVNGHMEGHICESVTRSIYQLENEANGDE